MIVKLVENKVEKEQALEIRRLVFIKERNVPHEQVIDAFDEDDSVINLLGVHNNKPIATGRIRFIDDYAKLERIAILKESRGKSFGAEIVSAMEEIILNHHYKTAVLKALTYTEAFYERLGYTTICNDSRNDSIPFVTMSKDLQKN